MVPMNGLSDSVRWASAISMGRSASATSFSTQIMWPVFEIAGAAWAIETSRR
ncbi:hypothetical protein FB001_101411 [Ensifer sp. SEMIA 135]|nr:hypothetical protein FB000_11311 [Ensifer sp. SEMIA 134]TWB41620.1 hypothetical protein FB001_101411 [Ensifer sp. SEMIA 135]